MEEEQQGTRTVEVDTVLCAYDFSETADVALEQAQRFARRHEAKLVLAHVVEPIPLGPYPVLAPPSSELAMTDLARKRLDQTVEALREEGTRVEPILREGEPGICLIELAKEIGADLVVVGTRGLSGFEHLALGSTAEYVVRRSECAVLTVHPEDRLLRDAIESVVLPTDLSESALYAVEYFISLFGPWERPQVYLVYADRTPPYLQPFQHEILTKTNQPDIVKESIEAKLMPIADRLRKADFPVEVAVLDGDPVEVTAELAKECEADLVLLSTRGRSALLNVLFGRTAQRIVQQAPCPVLTVRPEPTVADIEPGDEAEGQAEREAAAD
ncbi:MAG: universal stress protein [Myxococcota bacterium]